MLSPISKTLKMYALTGIVTGVKPKTGEVTVHNVHADGIRIPKERDYKLQDATAVVNAKQGDFVKATLLTDNADIWLLDDATFVTKRLGQRA